MLVWVYTFWTNVLNEVVNNTISTLASSVNNACFNAHKESSDIESRQAHTKTQRLNACPEHNLIGTYKKTKL